MLHKTEEKLTDIQAGFAKRKHQDRQQESDAERLRELYGEWKAIAHRFSSWANRNVLNEEIPGDVSNEKFAEHLSRLLHITKSQFGGDAVKNVVGFDSSNYKIHNSEGEPADQQRYFHAISVEWIISVLERIDSGENALEVIEASKKGLERCSKFELDAFSTRMHAARYVIRMGTAERFCERCGERLSVSMFDRQFCCPSDPKTDNEDESQETGGELKNEITKQTRPGEINKGSATGGAVADVKLEDHPKYDADKQKSLDFKNAGNSWADLKAKGMHSEPTIRRYAKATGQKILPSKSGRPRKTIVTPDDSKKNQKSPNEK